METTRSIKMASSKNKSGNTNNDIDDKKLAAWVARCKFWAFTDGSLYSHTTTARAPSKNFLQIFVSSHEVILRVWKILPPSRKDSHQAPTQMISKFADFTDDERMRNEIAINYSQSELDYIDRLVLGQIDYLNRLQRKVLLTILFKLDLVTISRLGQTCILFRELCSCDALWSKFYMEQSKKPITQELLMLVDQKGWKEVFFMNKLQLQMLVRRQGTKDTSSTFFLTSDGHGDHRDQGDQGDGGVEGEGRSPGLHPDHKDEYNEILQKVQEHNIYYENFRSESQMALHDDDDDIIQPHRAYQDEHANIQQQNYPYEDDGQGDYPDRRVYLNDQNPELHTHTKERSNPYRHTILDEDGNSESESEHENHQYEVGDPDMMGL